MSETLDTNTTKPQGKGLAVTGFILALVGLVFGWLVYGSLTIAAGIALGLGQEPSMGLGYFWIVLSVAAVVMSLMGVMKLGKTGGSKGLGIAGLVIGLVGLIFTIMMHLGVEAAAKQAADQAKTQINNIQW